MRPGSSFVRKGAAQTADPGTRPGLHGQTLVSSGHPDLDRLLGGGLPLGALLLLLEDGWSGHAATLMRYFLAEGAACGQSLLLAAAPPPVGGLPAFIPAQLKSGRQADKDAEEGEAGQGEEFKLRIAWQYRRYIKTGQQGTSSAAAAAAAAAGVSGGGLGPRSAGLPAAASRGSSSTAAAAGGAAAGGSRAGAASGTSGGGGGGARGVPPRKAAGLRDWCHQFDLLKAVGEEGLAGCRTELVDCSPASASSSSNSSSITRTGIDVAAGSSSDSAGSGGGGGGGPPSAAAHIGAMQHLVAAAAAFAQSLAPPPPPGQAQQQGQAAGVARAPLPLPAALRGPQHVGRLAVLSLGSLGWQPQSLSQQQQQQQQQQGQGQGQGLEQPPRVHDRGAGGGNNGATVLRMLLQLKGLLRDRRCAAVVSVPAALFSPSDLARMQHIADGVIALESVADDSDIVRLAPDPASVAGLLHLRKLPALGTVAPPLPEVALHLVRHRRRRVAITPVEIDPDAELADSEAASGLGRSVASVLCGGPPKADKAIDF